MLFTPYSGKLPWYIRGIYFTQSIYIHFAVADKSNKFSFTFINNVIVHIAEFVGSDRVT